MIAPCAAGIHCRAQKLRHYSDWHRRRIYPTKEPRMAISHGMEENFIAEQIENRVGGKPGVRELLVKRRSRSAEDIGINTGWFRIDER